MNDDKAQWEAKITDTPYKLLAVEKKNTYTPWDKTVL